MLKNALKDIDKGPRPNGLTRDRRTRDLGEGMRTSLQYSISSKRLRPSEGSGKAEAESRRQGEIYGRPQAETNLMNLNYSVHL
jgi:hypothetical protein